MDRTVGVGYEDKQVFDPSEGGQQDETPGSRPVVRAPAAREIIEIPIDSGTLATILNTAHLDGVRVTITSDSRLGLRFPNGGLIDLTGTEGFIAAIPSGRGLLLDHLNDDLGLLKNVLTTLAIGTFSIEAFQRLHELSAGQLPGGPQLSPPEKAIGSGIELSDGHSSLNSTLPANFVGDGIPALSPVLEETNRWGRDDIKRGEFGSTGQSVSTETGEALKHLTGLGDEEIGRRNGEKVVNSDNAGFAGASTDVGTSIDHLWLLGDVEYIRASRDLPEDALDPFEPAAGGRPVYGPLTDGGDSFRLIEDHTFSGQIFDPTLAGQPVRDIKTAMNPIQGTVVLNPDGSFVYVPAPHYSGISAFTYSFTDPRTGQTITGRVSLTVAAVADAPIVLGIASTSEDTPVAVPVSVELRDKDGSEEIENVVITGIPAGATLTWNPAYDAFIEPLAGGSFEVRGPLADIQALLSSLTLAPPKDFHGTLSFDVAVTSIEANVSPRLPGYQDRETVHHTYLISVEAVADPVTATGDSETTNEDTPVHLNDLAATFGDSLDGSETHVVEIRGVDPAAKLTNSAGIEYAFTLATDGSKTYTFTPAQTGSIYFLPPPDESGTFAGMTIVAIATEGSNGDQEIASAPISVVVDPVADPVDITAPGQTTDEDTPVTFGNDITIVVNDPLTQTITEVVVSGFPAGTAVTFTPVGGGAPVALTMGAGGSVTFNGGTEAEIRAALATLTLTPPPHTDQNITLSIAATTADLGGITDTQTVPMQITVAAVADGPNISGTASGFEDSQITVPIITSRIDADGSESYDFAEVTVPTGVTLTYTALPFGITANAIAGGFRFEPGATTTAAQFENFLAANISVQAPLHNDGEFDVTVKVGTIESVLSGGEVTLLRKDDTVSVPVTVTAVADQPTLAGAATVDEDVSGNIGNGITINLVDIDGTEYLSSASVTGFPVGSTVTYTPVGGGAPVVITVPAGGITVVLTGGTEAEIRTALATLELKAPLNTDQNITLSVSATTTDNDGSTATQTVAVIVAVAAVADGPSISGSATGNEDSLITVPVTLSRIDADGSESYDFAEVTVPTGVTLTYTALPFGITAIAIAGGFRFEPGAATTAAQFESFLVSNIRVQAPLDSDLNFGVSVKAGTIESTLSGGEVTLLKKDLAAVIPVSVNPVTDMPVVTGSSAVDEDASVNFGNNIAITENDKTDGSEAITQIVLGNIPAPAAVTYTATGGATVTISTVAGISTYTIGNGTEDDIRGTLKTFTLTPLLHSDVNIPVSVAITKTDQTTTEGEAAATSTSASTHNIAVAAVADGPNISGIAAGNEDQLISVPVTISRIDADGSESYDFATITVPTGVTLSYTALPFGITATAVAGGYTFVPGAATTSAQFEQFLANNIRVQAPLHSDGEFDVTVKAGTIESVLSGGEVTLLRRDGIVTIPVTVTAVADQPAISGSSAIDEDISGIVGDDIVINLVDTDGTEHISSVSVTGFPVGSVITYTPVGGGAPVTITVPAGGTTVTFTGGTAAEIRAALDTLALKAPLHTDQNITLSVSATTTDNDSSTATITTPFVVVVAAIADGPNIAGSASGNEDQLISVPVTISRIDADGSESYDFATITVPTGVTLSYTALPFGITATAVAGGYTFVPGAATTSAQFEQFLANNIRVQAPADSDVNFNVAVKVGTIESTLAGGEVTLLRSDLTTAVPVTVHPVNDAPVFTGTSMVNEDGILNAADQTIVGAVNFGANTGISATDSSDGSEAITQIVVSGLPIGAIVTFTPVGGSSITFAVAAGTTSITLNGGTEADIRAALATLSLIPPPHSDSDISLSISVTKVDATATEGEASVSQTYNGIHVITVAAIADVPVLSGSGSGLEDQNIAVSVTAGHPDISDGSEKLKNVVIGAPAAGLTISETSAGAGVLTLNGDGTYTVTGPNDAAINDVLANLVLVFAPGGARQHLDTDFNLTFTVTTIESAPSETGAGQMTLLETSKSFSVPVTVSAVADGVTTGGSSVLVEDIAKTIGPDITWSKIDTDGSEHVTTVVVSGFPAGTAVVYTDTLGILQTFVSTGIETVTLSGPKSAATETAIRAALDTLSVQAPLNSDVNITLSIAVTTTDNDSSAITQNFNHSINAQAVADAPAVTAGALVLDEDTTATLSINPNRSTDNDNSETLSVRITVPADGSGVIGTLSGTGTGGVTFTNLGGGVYSVTATGASAATREAALDTFLSGGITFTPRAQWSGVLAGTNGIKVEAISTEAANGYGTDLAPNNSASAGTGGDLDTKIETATAYIDIAVAPINDTPAVANASTIVQENNGSSSTADPDLIIPIGARLGLTIADTDGSQGLSMTLTGFPTNALALSFATSLAGVTTNVSIATGTVTINGASANDVLTVLNSLTLTLADDRDENFTISINGTSTDSNGSSTANDAFSLSHSVTVQAVADTPTIDVGTTTKSFVDEDSGFITYGVTTSLNDGDGSESYQSVVVNYSTAGTGIQPSIQFGTASGVTFDNSVAGQVTLTGPAADIEAALLSLQVKPGANNDADITITVTATAVESNPAEDNDGATAGMGGGIAGPEIAVPTAPAIQTFVIPVAALADTPTVSGSGAGFEDQNIPISITVLHPDTADGSEAIKNVVISGVPSGFTLSELSSGTGVLTANGGGTYTVTGPTDAAIQDVLTNLSLVITVGGPRKDLDTDFNLTATATTIESNPSEAGAGQGGGNEQSATATVAVTVTAVADGVTQGGSSTIVEDIAKTIGSDIVYTLKDTDGSEAVSQVAISGFTNGSTVVYTDMSGTVQTVNVTAAGLTLTFNGGTEAQIRAAVATINITPPLHSDANFNLSVSVTTTDNDSTSIVNTRNHSVTVQAVADAPTVSASNISLNEDTTIKLAIDPNRSADVDNTETMSVRITVPSDGSGVIGTLAANKTIAGVTFTAVGGGVYTATATGGSASLRETRLDSFLNDGVTFTPRGQWSGVLTGTNGIKVEAISTENATGGELAAGSFGGTDGTSKTETATVYINVTVAPVNDFPVLANASTIVQENNNSSNPLDPDLVIAIGTRLGLTIADTDGSQSLNLTLSGFPTNAQALSFGTTVAGVTSNINLATGTVTISGTASAVLTMINSLSITLADDRDENFTVTITGTLDDTNGTTSVSDPVSLTHSVTVQAVADTPTLNVGTSSKSAIDEDSGFIVYPVTVALNDTDGSETFQSILIEFSTAGSALGARPVVQFGTTTGVTSDASVAGQVTLTGTAADLAAAMATLQVKPGADNGEDITIRVTATSVESNPTEDNNGAVAGMGGGVAGAEISVPTAAIAQTFVIPVNPVPEIPVITVPGPASGSEDTTFAIGTITISTGSADPDGSETRFIEIDTSTFPSGTQFWSSGSTIGVAVSGWIRIPESALANLEIRAPLNYSGTMTLSVRGVVVDTNSTGSVTATTTPQTISVTVTPDADAISTPALSVGVEDNGAVAFGADLANATTGIRVTDNGTGGGNNADTETMSQIVLDFPADTATQTYTVVPGAAVGSAQIAFDSGTNTYTITSTIITGAANAGLLTQADRNLAEADIRATLNGFTVTMGPTHTDLNGAVAVTATTLDVNGGIANTQDNTFNHDIRIQAVADTPSVTVTDPASATPEDGSNILLTINAGNSADLDNSETVSVRITVPADSLGAVGTITGTPPANVTLTSLGGGIYLVQATGADNATRAASLNSFINGGGLAFDPRANWSGSLTGTNGIKIEVISTEAATGVELAATIFGGTDGTSKTETVTDYIDILISPAVDTPTVKGNGTGLEDTIISVPMSVTLNDKDGSETFIVKITSVVPAGTFIYGAGGALLVPDGFGVYTLTPADVAALAVKAPLHYSTATGGDVHLTTETIVTDTSGGGTSVSSFITTIDVQVTGVADQPGTRTVNVVADEDDLIQIGSHILSSAGGDLNNLLVDTDGSESLSFVIGGLPAGIIPVSSVAGVAYLGNGTWSVSAAAMPTLTLPPVQNFSGENPYSGVTVRAVTQEIDGSQATSPQWPVSIVVNPVIAGGTVDGFSSWGLGATQSEAASESGTNISLASSLNYTLADNDGSETVIEYTFNLTNLITNAGIATQLSSLPGAGSGIDKLVANYITGTFVYDSGAKTITVQASLIGGVALSSQLFLDSNRDFSIPVTALVRDTAIIGGSPVTVDKLESGSFGVNFTGTADVPTVFANSVSGNSGTSIPLTLGGTTTDTDVTLGRLQSEDIFYVLRTTNTGTAPLFGLTDSFGNVVGIDTGNGSFLINPSDLADLRIITPPGAGGTINFELTTVATENDGDRATNSTNFTVTVVPLAGTGPGDAPLPPAVTVGANNGNEDGPITLNVSAVPAAGDLTNPSVSVVISGIPAGAQVTGAILLPPVNVGDAPRWVATAAAVNGGAVHVTPPPDFSGTMNITVEGIARNVNLQSATTGPRIVPILVDPVADGVAIGASPAAGSEDLPIALGLSLGEVDTDGSEDIGVFCYVKLTNGATVIGGYPAVAAGDSDATIDGTSLVGYYRVPTSSAASLQIQPALNWHGSIGVTVAAYSVEPVDSTPDADNTKLSTSNFTVSVTAVADAPAVSAPATVSGSEDTAIALTDGVTLLSAALADTVADNGAEVLSVKISGVPDGSRFSSGSNNGDGSWTIPVSALATLSLTPPLNYSGTMTLTLTAITLELSNGNEAQTSVNFNAVVSPAADSVEILARDLTIDVAGQVALDLNVRLSDTTGSSPGENAEEQIRITFTSVPVGVALTAASGGAMTNPSAGTFQFTGTQTQANSILAIAGAGATGGNHVISISAVTLDGASTLASPVTDSFILTLPDILTGTASDDTLTSATGTQLLFGLAGADTLNGGLGADRMTGGDGNDTYTADNAGDVIVENAGEGSADLVQTTLATYSLGANLENLTFTGAGNFTGTGTSAANIITGGTGNDTLDGSIGADTLNGGGGDDTYVIDNAADSITDTSGIDTVQTSLATYTLAANLENLIFTGAGNFTGNGNGAGNVITGGTGNDTLDGGIGADTLDGGGGSDILRGGTGIDILSGGAGIDTYRWQAGDNSGGSDQITDFVNGVGGDTLDISALLVGFTGSSVLSDFVRKTEGAGNTTISIDTDGAAGGANFVDLVVLQGQTGIDLNQMKTNGNLIV